MSSASSSSLSDFPLLNDDDLAANPEPRCAVAILLDTSASMAGEPIRSLQAGLADLLDNIRQDELACQRCELALISFGGSVTVIQDFATCDAVHSPSLEARGNTPMGEAVTTALDCLQQRQDQYRAHGVRRYKPWVFILTDGAPTDDTESAAARLREMEASGNIACFGVGVGAADLTRLGRLMHRPPLHLKGLAFAEMFEWISQSLSEVSRSQPGDGVDLPSCAGWARL